jgi:uncharacterized protein
MTCSGDALIGVLTEPQVPGDCAVIVIVGGPQYRVGSHRQFVKLSRSLAEAGLSVLRFDYRGMGDSEGHPRDFQTVSADIATAIDHLLQQLPAVKRLALWGLCDGASAALLYCFDTQDPRVQSLCLVNPWVRSETSLARTQVKHYYLARIKQADFWRKLLRGEVATQALLGLARNIRSAISNQKAEPAALSSHQPKSAQLPFQARMAAAWNEFQGDITLILSGQDFVAKEFLEICQSSPAWQTALSQPWVIRHDLPQADHTFSDPASGQQLEALTLASLMNAPSKNLA